jgi:hypothetical protein
MEVQAQDVRGRWVAGVALVVIGLVSLLTNIIDSPSLGMLIVPTLGLVFTLWGIVVRQVGLLIPGGILSGIGLGIYLVDGPFSALSGDAEAGVFLLAFALGWGLITLLSAFVERIHWWPLIPGGILALIGGALLQGGLALEILAWVGKLWPLGLIAFGLYLVLRRK